MRLLGIFAIILFLSAIEGKPTMNCKFFYSKSTQKRVEREERVSDTEKIIYVNKMEGFA